MLDAATYGNYLNIITFYFHTNSHVCALGHPRNYELHEQFYFSPPNICVDPTGVIKNR